SRHRLADSIPLLGPVLSAHPRDPRRLSAGVFPDGRELVGRDVEAVLPLVRDHQVLPLDAGHGAGHEALEPADAVLVVDHVVALGEIAVVLALDPTAATGPPVRSPPAGDLLLAEDRHPGSGGDEAVMDSGGEDHRLP